MAQALSRRDVPTQLALIEMQVRRGNIVAALRHYDIILRISTTYDSLLLPVLASAMAEPQVLAPLSRRLANAPMWRRRFLSYVVNAGTPYEAQYRLFSALARADGLVDRDIVAASAANSALSGDYLVAWKLHDLLFPENVHGLRNGSFEHAGIAPFDWQIENGGPIEATVDEIGGGHRLDMTSVRGDGGRGARQLLRLPAGLYDLAARFGALEAQKPSMPYLRLVCAQTGEILATAGGSDGTDRLRTAVSVTAACPYQWLEAGLQLDMGGAATAAWLDGVTLGRVNPPTGND